MPVMLEEPGVVVDRHSPGSDELSVAPARIVVAEAVRTQHAVLLEMREMTMALAAITDAPAASRARAVMLLVEKPSASIVEGLAERMTCVMRVSNLAPTVCAALIVTEQLLLPAQAPLHSTKTEAESAVAVSTTTEPAGKSAVQIVPQLMSPDELVTIPPPDPAFVTVSVWLVGSANAASTVVAASIVTMQGAVPLQPPPLQPLKVLGASAAAVRVTTVSLA